MTIDLQRQLDAATAFFLAAERCALEFRFGQYDFHVVNAPTIVNYAFAVELALKVIHSVTMPAIARGHKLDQLYRALPDDIRTNLRHLSECVTDISSYFEEWRYPFEKAFLVGEYENPRRAFIECYQEIRRLRPDLISAYEAGWGSFKPEWVQTWNEALPRWELRPAGG